MSIDGPVSTCPKHGEYNLHTGCLRCKSEAAPEPPNDIYAEAAKAMKGADMPHLERYLRRHAARRASDTPDEHLLGLSIATSLARLVEINEELLLMARENQEVIRAMNDMNNVDKGEQHGQSGHTDTSGIG